jgi:hypothetical protein
MTNCLLFAVALYVRRFAPGRRQYVQIRKSDMGWFPHFLYAEKRRGRMRMVSYKPLNPVKRIFPPLMFAGSVCWGDSPATHPGEDEP